MPSAVDKTTADFLASLVREMRGPDDSVSFDKIAKELGVSKPQVVNLVKNGKGAGPKVEEAFAQRKFGGSIDQLRAAARAWVAGQVREKRNAIVHGVLGDTKPADARQIVIANARYEALTSVLSEPAHANRWSKHTIAAAESMALDADTDLDQGAWVELLDRLDTAIAISMPKVPARGESPLAGLDEPRMRPARKKR